MRPLAFKIFGYRGVDFALLLQFQVKHELADNADRIFENVQRGRDCLKAGNIPHKHRWKPTHNNERVWLTISQCS